MTRAQHMQWCKDRALEYCKQGNLTDAWSSMVSDLGKHDETKDHIGIELGIELMFLGNLSTPDEMEKFINDFA